MEFVLWVVSAAVMVVVLVVVHEAGHFFIAKAFGVGAPVFSIGMGPRLFGFVWRGTDFRVSLLPIGGYVQLSGADPFGEEDPDTFVDPSRDFMRKPVWQRLLIMLGGPAMNLALPFVLFSGVLMLGEPQLDNTIGTVIPGTPVEAAGLRSGDRIVVAAGVDIDVWPDLVRVLDDQEDKAVPIRVERAGATLEVVLPEGSITHTKDGFVDTERIGFWQARRSSRIGVSDPTSAAWLAGLHVGDAIIEVDGRPLRTFEELDVALADPVPHTLMRARVVDGEVVRSSVELTPAASQVGPQTAGSWGIVHLGTFVGTVLPDSAAGRADIRVGDRLVAIDGVPIRSWSDVLGLVGKTVTHASDGDAAVPRPLALEVIREGAPMTIAFEPTVEREVVRGSVNFRPIMGVKQFGELYVDGPEIKKFYSPPKAIARGFEEGSMVFVGTLTVLGNLVAGNLKPQESLGGPIEIFRAAGESAKDGIFSFARMMGMISFSLGIINLLPVPVLDGGQIVFYTIEGLRGRPLPLMLRERIQMAGVVALFALFIMVTVMDVSRWLGS